MTELFFTRDHEWARVEGDDEVVVGISDFAQGELGDVVFVELPEISEEFNANEKIAVIESVKTAADVNAPVSGTVIEVNEELADTPELINISPIGDGWLCKLRIENKPDLDNLLNQADYDEYVASIS